MASDELEWRNGLKPGDVVAVSRGGYGRIGEHAIAKVDAVTATQILVGKLHDGSPVRYRRKDGRQVGWTSTGWSRTPEIVRPTQEIRDKVERARLIASIKAAHLETLPLDALREAVKILRPHPTEQPR